MVEKAPGEAGPALAVQTDGIHFPAAWEASDVVDAAQARPLRRTRCTQPARPGGSRVFDTLQQGIASRPPRRHAASWVPRRRAELALCCAGLWVNVGPL